MHYAAWVTGIVENFRFHERQTFRQSCRNVSTKDGRKKNPPKRVKFAAGLNYFNPRIFRIFAIVALSADFTALHVSLFSAVNATASAFASDLLFKIAAC